jgi:hypothetical protein
MICDARLATGDVAWQAREHMRSIAAFAKFEPVLYEVASVRA